MCSTIFQVVVAPTRVLNMIEVVLNSIVLAFALGLLAMASRFAIKLIEDLVKLTRLSEASVGFAILSVMTTYSSCTFLEVRFSSFAFSSFFHSS
jgi:hypothetical protein